MNRHSIQAIIVAVALVPGTALAQKKDPEWFVANVKENHCYELSAIDDYGQPVTTPDDVIAILRAEDERLVTSVERPNYLKVFVTLANGEEIFFVKTSTHCKNYLSQLDMERRRQATKEAKEKAAREASITLDERYLDEGVWYVGFGRETLLDISDPEYGLDTTPRSSEGYVRRVVDCRKLSDFLQVTESDVPYADSLEELELLLEEKYKKPAHISRNDETERLVYLIYHHPPRNIKKPHLEFEEILGMTPYFGAAGFYAFRNKELCETIVKTKWSYSNREIDFGWRNSLKMKQQLIEKEMTKHPEYFMSEDSRTDERW